MSLTNPQSVNTKYAIPKLVKDPNGRPLLIYIDTVTGERLDSLEGYTLIQNENSLESIRGQPTTPEPAEVELTDLEAGEEDRGFLNRSEGNYTPNQSLGTSNVQRRDGPDFSRYTERTPQQNYGYIDRPNYLSLTNSIPGVLGTASKATDVAIQANNSLARNRARETLGQEKKNVIGQTFSSMLGIRDPSVVSRVAINSKPYAVGFEALDKKGNTTLTPQEARRRSLTLDSQLPVAELTNRQFTALAPQTQSKQNARDRGLIGNVVDGARRGVSNLVRGFVGGNNNPVPTGNTQQFPDAPTETNTQQASSNRGLGGPSGRDISARTQDAIDSGQSGLF